MERKSKSIEVKMPNIPNSKPPERTFDGKKYTLYITVAKKAKATAAKAYLNRYGVKNHVIKVKNGYAVYVR